MTCKYFPPGWIHPRTNLPVKEEGTWCETLDEAIARAVACPPECFIYDDGPTSHPYRPIPGYPCAHYTAHQLGIQIGRRYERCMSGYSVMIGQVIQGKNSLPLDKAQVNDIWTNRDRSHCGVVRSVNADRVLFEACSTSGRIYREWATDGYVWR